MFYRNLFITLLLVIGSSSAALAYSPAHYTWSGYHDSDCSWSTASTSLADPSDDASCTFTQVTNYGFGTVSSSGSKAPGITFTPRRLGVHMIIATFQAATNSAGARTQAQMTDGSNNELDANSCVMGAGSAYCPFTMVGFLNVTSLTSQTVKLRFATSTGTFGTTQIQRAISWKLMSP
jgi:hypothetical protein